MPDLTVQRLVLVGAGHRAGETILPALLCLRDRVELAGVVTRTARRLSLYDSALTLDTHDSFDRIDLASVDGVVIAVSPKHVPGVLRTLLARDGGHLRVMIDTPVLEPHGFGALKLLRRFAHVSTSEDSIALPPIVLARQLIDDGAVGRLRFVSLAHSGYRHHALASLRHLTGGLAPKTIRIRRWNASWGEVRLTFPRGVRATILEPRSYDAGRFLIAGDSGSIVDYPLERTKNTVRLGYVIEGGRYAGMTVDDHPVDPTPLDEAFAEHLPRPSSLPDSTLRGMLKVRGLMDLIEGMADGAGGATYDPIDAICDDLSLRIAQKTRYLRDVQLGGRRRLLSLGVRVLGSMQRGEV